MKPYIHTELLPNPDNRQATKTALDRCQTAATLNTRTCELPDCTCQTVHLGLISSDLSPYRVSVYAESWSH